MNNSLLQVPVNLREITGKKVKSRRKLGFIPANVVLSGQPSLAIEVPLTLLMKTLDQVGYTQALELLVDDRKLTVLVTDISFAPTNDTPQHVVFLEVKKGAKVSASIPLVLDGQAPGEQKGLMILQTLNQIEVIASALSIPEQITVDISHLDEDGDVIRILDLNLPVDLKLDMDEQTVIVKLEKSRSQISQQAEEKAEEKQAAAEKESTETDDSSKENNQVKESDK